MRLETLINKIRSIPDCSVAPPTGHPLITTGHRLPNDVADFYYLCGGVDLYRQSAYSISIVSPERFVLANPTIFIGIDGDELARSQGDRSWNWYIVAEGENRQYITIDLAPERLGHCYDSFWDSHAMPGSSPIIAQTFTELLENLIDNAGRHWYWLQPEFAPLGDAYD